MHRHLTELGAVVASAWTREVGRSSSRQNHHHQASVSGGFLSRGPLKNFSGQPMAARDAGGAGSARRRRERRLRSMLRHERQTVAMELTAALHHSCDVGLKNKMGRRSQQIYQSGRERKIKRKRSEKQRHLPKSSKKNTERSTMFRHIPRSPAFSHITDDNNNYSTPMTISHEHTSTAQLRFWRRLKKRVR